MQRLQIKSWDSVAGESAEWPYTQELGASPALLWVEVVGSKLSLEAFQSSLGRLWIGRVPMSHSVSSRTLLQAV
ncbi:MAG: hypothetical protein HS109_08825 [Burkholderiales bacterium]|nr:hypothetical protein [Burkholderiales bacterium]